MFPPARLQFPGIDDSVFHGIGIAVLESATTIISVANRFGTENVSGNDWSRKSRRSNCVRMTMWLSVELPATRRPRYRQ